MPQRAPIRERVHPPPLPNVWLSFLHRVKVYLNEHPPVLCEMASGTQVGLNALKQWKTQCNCSFASDFDQLVSLTAVEISTSIIMYPKYSSCTQPEFVIVCGPLNTPGNDT